VLATSANIGLATALEWIGGELYVAEMGNSRIMKVRSSDSYYVRVAGSGSGSVSGSGGAALSAGLGNVRHVTADASLNLYICATANVSCKHP